MHFEARVVEEGGHALTLQQGGQVGGAAARACVDYDRTRGAAEYLEEFSEFVARMADKE